MDGLTIRGPGLQNGAQSPAALMREMRGPSELGPLQPGGTNGTAWPAGEGFASVLKGVRDGQGVSGVTNSNPADALSGALTRGVNAVNGDLEAADATTQAFVRGENVEVHEVMLAMTKADTSFRLMTTVGRKVIEAYQDVMRMQV